MLRPIPFDEFIETAREEIPLPVASREEIEVCLSCELPECTPERGECPL